MSVDSFADTHTSVVRDFRRLNHIVVHDIEIDHAFFQRPAERIELFCRAFRAHTALKIPNRQIQSRFADTFSACINIAQPLHIPVEPSQFSAIHLVLRKDRQFLREQRTFAAEREIEEIENVDPANGLIPDDKAHERIRQTRSRHAEAFGHGELRTVLRGGRRRIPRIKPVVSVHIVPAFRSVRRIDLPPDNVHAGDVHAP